MNPDELPLISAILGLFYLGGKIIDSLASRMDGFDSKLERIARVLEKSFERDYCDCEGSAADTSPTPANGSGPSNHLVTHRTETTDHTGTADNHAHA